LLFAPKGLVQVAPFFCELQVAFGMAERPLLEKAAEPGLPDRRHVTMHGLGDEEASVTLLRDAVNQPNRLFRQRNVDASVHTPMVHIDDVYVNWRTSPVSR